MENKINDLTKQADIVSKILIALKDEVKPGVSLIHLDKRAVELCNDFKVTPYNLGYKPEWAKTPFPGALCTSVNGCIAHGIPTDYKLKEGDWVNLDIGIKVDGLCGDSGFTIPVGELEHKNERMLRYAKRALYMGIRQIKAGAEILSVGRAISQYIAQMGYVPVESFSGHGIGEEMHMAPPIPNFYISHPMFLKQFVGRTFYEGQVVCIEPMITFRDTIGKLHQNGWSVLTRDGRYCAMFEHMVLVTKDGYKILTTHFDESFAEDLA